MKYLKNIAIFFFDILDFFHQKKILKHLKQINIKINYFFDVGAHKGLYTDLITKNFKVKKTFMFEPQSKIFSFIKEKYKKKKNIKIFKFAASNKNSLKFLNINKHDLTSSLNDINKENIYLKFKSKLFGENIGGLIIDRIEVKTIKLDDIIVKNKIKKIELLKIDTEGHEFEVLKGIKKNLQKILILLIEFRRDQFYLNYNDKLINNFLIKNNFSLFRKLKFPFTKWEDRIYLNKKYFH